MKPVNLLIVNCFLVFLCTAPCANAMGLRDLFKSVKGLFSKKKDKKESETIAPRTNLVTSQKKLNPLTYLEKYGYSLGIKSRQSLLASPYSSSGMKIETNTEFSDMIRLFQSLFQLEVTGKLDNNTIEQMNAPRCGFPDILDENSNYQPIVKKKQKNLKAPAAYVLSGTKWKETSLTYKFLNYNIELGKDGTRFAINKAFNYWSKHAQIDFQEVCEKCQSDFVLEFAQGDHGDGYSFDGPSGVLAHAFFPQNGKIHFDEAEHFTENTKEGINLRLVAAHEIGHALGLDHSAKRGALMFPTYAGYIPLDTFDLDEDDILGIRSIYGYRQKPQITTLATTKRTTPNRTTPRRTTPWRTTPWRTTPWRTTTPRRTTSRKTKPPRGDISPCNPRKHRIQAAFKNSKKGISLITNYDDLWEYDVKRRTWTKYDLLKRYPGIVSGVRGGVTCKSGFIWFFKDRRVWAFRGYRLQKGYPKRIKDRLFPSNPYTASIMGGKMYVLKGSLAYRFDAKKLRTDGKFPKHVRQVFNGIPTWIEASLEYKNEHYMFKGEWVYKMKGRKGHEKVIRGYPKRIQDAWFPCFQSRLN